MLDRWPDRLALYFQSEDDPARQSLTVLATVVVDDETIPLGRLRPIQYGPKLMNSGNTLRV